MDFSLTDDQLMLKESVAKVLTAHYGDFAKRSGYLAEPAGFDRSVWTQYAEAGLLALPIPLEHGGLGGGPVENMIVMEEVGRALAIEPYLSSAILCGAILRQAAPGTPPSDLLGEMASGAATLALAHTERESRFDLHNVAFRARLEGDVYVLDGEKSVVLGGAGADWLIVSVRTAGERFDRAGISLMLVDAAAPGVTRRGYPTQDGYHAADMVFRGTRVPRTSLIGDPGAGLPVLERAVDEAIAALCAEAVGAMDALHQLTVEYLKTRKQFGVAIGSFQVLQHRAVDMLIMLELARSMAVYAAIVVAEADESTRRAAVSAAKVQVGRSARFIGQQATQLHGGIGLTMEYKAGHYFKRLTMIEQQFGDSDHHQRFIAAAGGLPAD